MGQFVGCIEGMREACRALDFPVVSGNVSFYNETDGQPIWPTPTIGGLGVIDDLDHVGDLAYQAEDLALVLVGESFGWLGSSLYLREICGREEGLPPPVDLALERLNGEFVRELIGRGWVAACHDLADGGLYVALAEMALASGIGADLEVPTDCDTTAGWLFGEEQARYLLAIAAGPARAPCSSCARTRGVLARRVGTTGGRALTLDRRQCHILGRACRDPRRPGCRRTWPRAAALHEVKRMAMTAEEIGTPDPRRPARRRDHARGSRRRRQSLPRPCRVPGVSRQDAGYSSTRWSTKPWAGAWAACCTHLP